MGDCCPTPTPTPVNNTLQEIGFLVFLLILALLGLAFITSPMV